MYQVRIPRYIALFPGIWDQASLRNATFNISSFVLGLLVLLVVDVQLSGCRLEMLVGGPQCYV